MKNQKIKNKNFKNKSSYTSKYKPIFTRNHLSEAVALACLGSMSVPTMAGTGPCSTAGLNTISGPETTQCGLVDGDSLDITGTGSIILTDTAVWAEDVTLDFISNAGLIDATSGYGIYAFGNFAGGITNSGVIDSDWYGLYVYNKSGDVTNSGTIITGETGIYVFGANNVTNSGTITAAYKGIYLNGSVGGDILNSGIITASDSGIYLNGIVGGDILNSGTITASDFGIYVNGVVTGNVNNSGTITASVRLRYLCQWCGYR